MNAHLLRNFRRNVTFGAAALAATLILTGCAALQPKAPEVEVAERATERWQALIAKDYARAYAYTQPGFRAVVPREGYGGRFNPMLDWKKVVVQEVTCEAERCTARLGASSKILMPQFRSLPETFTYFNEVWVRDQGQWWYFERL